MSFWVADEFAKDEKMRTTKEETKEEEYDEQPSYSDYLDIDSMMAGICARIYDEPDPSESNAQRNGGWCCSCQQASKQDDLLEVRVGGNSKSSRQPKESSDKSITSTQ